MKRCKATGKIKWTTRLDAMIALADTTRRDRDETRYYHCPDCRTWHLTKQRKGR